MESIRLAIKQNRLAAKIPYADGLGPEKAKEITGRKWHPEEKFWSYPLKFHNAKKLRAIADEMGVNLLMSDKVLAWTNEEKAKVKAQKALQSVDDGPVDLPTIRQHYPDIWKAMQHRPFQTKGVKFGLDNRSFILGDDPGLGKTLQTISMMIEADVQKPILVVANVSAKTISWPNEIRKWDPDATVTVFGANVPAKSRAKVLRNVFEEAEKASALGEVHRQYVLINPYWVKMKIELDEYGKFVRDSKGLKVISATQPELFENEWGAIIVDESQETLATSTGNAKKWSQQRVGLAALPLAENGFRISISGTPFRGNSLNAFGQLEWLNPEEYTSYWNWAKEFFVVTESDGFGMYDVGEIRDPKAFNESLNRVMIRRLKEQVASDLPPKQYGGHPHPNGDVVGVWLPMLPKQAKIYKDFVKSASLVDDDGNELSAVGVLAVYTRMRQLANSCASVGTRFVNVRELDADGKPIKMKNGKFKLLIDPNTGKPMQQPEQILIPELPSNKYEWLKEWLTERDLLGKNAKGTGKVIIASQFRQSVDMFRKALQEEGTESFCITGATNEKQRVWQQDEFQNNPDSPKLFFLQSKAGGTSLTLDMADDVIILDEMWDPDIQNQIEDRAHRLSRKHNVTIWYVRSLETIEEYIGTSVEERDKTTKLVLNGYPVQKKLLRK